MKKIALILLVAFYSASFGASAVECKSLCRVAAIKEKAKCQREQKCFDKTNPDEQLQCMMHCERDIGDNVFDTCFRKCI